MIELAILRLLWKWKRQGMDEEKATKCDKIAKNTFSTFQSCAFAFKDLMKNSCKLRTRLFQSKLFSSSRKFNFQSFKFFCILSVLQQQ